MIARRRIALALVLPLLWILSARGCAVNPATGDLQLITVTDEQINAMAAGATQELVEGYGGEVDSPQLRAYVDRIGFRLAEHVEPAYQDVRWSFTVLDSDIINAFALPDGQIFISRGLMERMTNEAQLAGVLGHEIGHVTGKHVHERVSRSELLRLGAEALGTYTESELAEAGATVFGNTYQLHFGRGQEIQSDQLGMRYMVRAGYDPRGMLQLLGVLQEAMEGVPRQFEFFSTHPYPETRQETVQELLRTTYKDAANDAALVLGADRYQREAVPYLR